MILTKGSCKILIFAWLDGEIAKLQQQRGYTFPPEKAYKILMCLAVTMDFIHHIDEEIL